MATNQLPKHLPSAIRKLCQHGEAALRPRFVNGRWRGAAVKARASARVRKEAILDGTYGTFDPTTGKGWDASWDKPGKISSIRAPKESKRDRNREDRAIKIEKLMEGMDEKISEYRQSLLDKKPEPGIVTLYKSKMAGSKKK
eukprot:CAMPEP_0195521362 /NCGR_PEP_ID=MMETSP0794_2-20130614/18541_1 /TAXON_ID=515487 /ORGANISM="Stephanopyxis turris, Strain CCMP 815" /LENGTH=141 /DNA_ID=CAMNT_0040650899 /DNA_START=80 /DNA_END=508 /DNA_ORIENTATION=+